jgi:heterotetrameric sarcosine oxidase beta subunit
VFRAPLLTPKLFSTIIQVNYQEFSERSHARPNSMKYSAFTVLREALSGHKGWQPAWRDAAPAPAYDVVIIGGGGHGLATAFYLAKYHKPGRIAVVEKSWLGSGSIGRNTTIIRSNYLLPGNVPFYELSLKLWEGLEQEVNYNAMVSQRGVFNIFHSDAQRDAYARRGNAMRLHGVDAQLLDRDELRRRIPYLDYDNARFPVQGALLQGRGGTVRHDAVAWGYAGASPGSRRRAASSGLKKSGSRSPARPHSSPPWPGCACPSRATRCRPLSPRRSNR